MTVRPTCCGDSCDGRSRRCAGLQAAPVTVLMTGNPVVEVRPASERDRALIEEMLDDYLRELAQYREGDAGPASAMEYPFLSYYFTKPERYAFTIRADHRTVGFALVRRITADDADDTEMQIAEFYIEPGHRRRGVGCRAAAALWARFPGAWQLEVMARNRAAVEFWDRCIVEHAEGPREVEERHATDGRRLRHRFTVSGGRSPERGKEPRP